MCWRFCFANNWSISIHSPDFTGVSAITALTLLEYQLSQPWLYCCNEGVFFSSSFPQQLGITELELTLNIEFSTLFALHLFSVDGEKRRKITTHRFSLACFVHIGVFSLAKGTEAYCDQSHDSSGLDNILNMPHVEADNCYLAINFLRFRLS